MTEFVDPSISRPRLVRKRIVSALIILVESGGFIGLTALLLSGRLMDALVVLQLMLAVALPVTVMWATVRRHRNWHQPLGQLQELIPQVRDGVEPIESLGKVGGKLATLAAVCQQMLRDIREEKLRIRNSRKRYASASPAGPKYWNGESERCASRPRGTDSQDCSTGGPSMITCPRRSSGARPPGPRCAC